ncbi:ester cyclase [Halogeometricum limi]|uniref:SnoaL-like polyketide cyclase n=1 Tax=Halogeometricum limi TaxID=555875 RepID=A0A1I6FZ00_9EURY|nr:ester cyclase [Halogeometricum limi]SFR35169.1 conserved hypothetical protein, steroid delta-isomerase-related [Halogeometricum limi]
MAGTQNTRNKELVRHLLTEVWQRKNVDAVDELFSEDVLVGGTRTSTGDRTIRRDDLKEIFREWLEAFPDASVESHALLAEHDAVVSFATLHGTHEGAFRGVSPTHEPVEMRAFALYRIRDGRVVEYTAIGELLKLMEQLESERPLDA